MAVDPCSNRQSSLSPLKSVFEDELERRSAEATKTTTPWIDTGIQPQVVFEVHICE